MAQELWLVILKKLKLEFNGSLSRVICDSRLRSD